MAIKFYGGHQLNSKAKVYGTRQDFEVIEVDVDGNELTSFPSADQVVMHLDAQLESVADGSATPVTLSVNGNTSVADIAPYSTYAEGADPEYSYTFDGDGDYIRADAALSSFTSSTQPFTIEKYVKFNSLIGDCFVTSLNAVSDGYNNLLIGHYGSQWRLNTNGGNNDFGTIQTGVWYHVAVVYEGGSSDVKVYIDGQLKTTRSWGRPALNVNTLLIGADADAGNAGNLADWIDGEIRDYRISSTAVYTENFTPAALSLTSDTEFYLSPSVSTITDASTNNHPVTVHGNASVASSAPLIYTGKSIYFDGSGDYIRADEALDSFTSTTDPFTIEFWMRPERFNDSMAVDVPFAINSIATGSNELIFVGKNHTDLSRGQYVTLDGSNTNPSYTLGLTLQDYGPWYHIAMTYDGTTFKLYVDGTVAISQNIAFTIPFADCSLLIGADADTANAGSLGNYYKGHLADLRISNVVVYTENFVVADQPLAAGGSPTLPSQVSLHLNGTDSGIVDSSSNSHAVTISGDTAVVEGSPYDPTGPQSLLFDGNGDYIDVAANSSFDLGTGDFTMESWFKTTATSTDSYYRRMLLLDGPTGNNSSNIQLAFTADGKVNAWTTDGQIDILSSAGFNDGNWHHTAITRSGTTLTLWVDGASAGSVTTSQSFSPNGGSPRPRIGNYSGSGEQGDWDGSLADIRIVKGTAIYTDSYTVPSAPLTAVSGTRLLVSDLSDTSLSVNGNVSVVSDSPYANTSMSFDGNGDYISIADHDDFNFGSGDFTVEMWINAATQSTNWPGIFSGSNYNAAGSASLRFDNVGHDNKLFLYTNGLGDPALTTTNTLSHNTWHHIALVRSGTSLSFYVNGTQDGTTTISSSQTFDFSVGEFRIGRGFDVDGGNAYFAGKIADVRAIKGSAVVPTAAPTSALTTDAGSQVAFAELSTTDVKSSYPPVIDGLSVSASNSQDTWSHGRATMSFTSGKYYWEATPNGNGMIGLELDTADVDRTFVNNGQDTLAARDGKIWKDGTLVVSGQSDWTDGDVVGIAVDGDTGLVQFYINGVAGMSHNTGWGSDKVKIPSYGVYKNSSNDWSWTFNFGAGGFAHTPPAGYQALSGTETITPSLLISGNKTISDASPSSHSLTLNGDVTTAAGFPYAAALGKSITFDGSGDYISIPTSNNTIIGSGDFTFETWIKLDTIEHQNRYLRIAEAGPYTDSTGTWRLGTTGQNTQLGLTFSGTTITSNDHLSLNDWHHVAVSRSGTTVAMFINGVKQTQTMSSSANIDTPLTHIGTQVQPETWFHGEMADVRLIIGTAVYTENFSVPTATLGDYPPPPVRYYKTLATPYVPQPTIVTEGLVFHVDAGNTSSYSGSGTTWTDLSGNGIDGTLVNGPTYSSDDGGKIVFDNSNDYISFASPSLAFGTGPFAMEIWVKVTSAPDQFDQIMQGRNPDATSVFWGYRSGNLDFVNNNDTYPLLRKAWPTQGEWTHLVITRDASNIVSLYRNGVLDGDSNYNAMTFDQTEMTIGSSSGYNVGREVGLARLYVNKGLSAEEVTQNYNDAKSRFGY